MDFAGAFPKHKAIFYQIGAITPPRTPARDHAAGAGS